VAEATAPDPFAKDAFADIDRLYRSLMPFAERVLGKYGYLVPAGATIDAEGRLNVVGAASGDLPVEEAVAGIYAGFREQADELRAVGVVTQVQVPDGAGGDGVVDAIAVELEHLYGKTLRIVVPYMHSRLLKRVRLGDSRVAPGTVRVWVVPGGAGGPGAGAGDQPS